MKHERLRSILNKNNSGKKKKNNTPVTPLDGACEEGRGGAGACSLPSIPAKNPARVLGASSIRASGGGAVNSGNV